MITWLASKSHAITVGQVRRCKKLNKTASGAGFLVAGDDVPSSNILVDSVEQFPLLNTVKKYI